MGMNFSKETSLCLSKHPLILSLELSNFGMVASYLSDKLPRYWYWGPEEESAMAYEASSVEWQLGLQKSEVAGSTDKGRSKLRAGAKQRLGTMTKVPHGLVQIAISSVL